jgi:hypothetical protein
VIAGVALLGVLAALVLGAAAASGGTTGPPVSTSTPTASGLPGVGKTLRTTSGSWSTSATFTYQWLRCAASYKGCANIPGPPTYVVISGATAATYVPVAADMGHVLVARVTATNAAGSASVDSSGLGPVEGRPPGPKHLPWIKGTKTVGQRIYETDDRWTRSPYKWSHRWLRCSVKGDACVRITGKARPCGACSPVPVGTQSDYKLTRKDVGHRMRVQVTAWNGAGHTTSTSEPTRIVEK